MTSLCKKKSPRTPHGQLKLAWGCGLSGRDTQSRAAGVLLAVQGYMSAKSRRPITPWSDPAGPAGRTGDADPGRRTSHTGPTGPQGA
jgi:hypothetical protein